MEATNLLPLDEEHDSVNISARSLNVWVHCCPAAQGVAVRRGLLDERKLTSVHVGSIQVELVKTVHRQRRLAPDNPFLSDDQRNRLDGDGVIVAGRRVNVGDVLVSVVEVDKTMRPRRAGLQWIRDASERVPPGWDDAHVLSATRLGRRHLGRSAGRTIDERIKIAIRAEHPLSTGDILLVRQHVLGIVSRMVPDDEMPKESDRIADLAVSSEAAAELGLGKGMHILDVGKAGDLGVFNVHAHADGLYSLITQQPLGGRLHPTLGTPDVPCPASVTTAHVRWLRERGLNHLLAELVSLKSDDRHHRSVVDRLRDTDAPAEDYPVPGTPQSLYILRAELISLGLHVECIGNGQVTLRLRPATREELLSYSNGAIEKPDTIAYQNLKEVPGGILCPNVFGNDYRFGHFELPVPIVPYLWRIGSPSPLTRMLGIDAEQIEALLYYHSYVRRSDGDLPWRLADNALPDDPSHWLTGAEAVRALLADVAAEAIPAALRGRVDAIIQNVVLLPPAFMRPVILLDSGNFATSDLNDLYAQLINRAKRLAKLMQLNAPAVIVREECRMLQQCADGLWANCVLPEEIAVHDETSSRRLVDLLDLATKRIINAGRKRVTRSGRARAVAESSVPDGEVLIPRQIFDSLRLSPEQPVVMTSPEGNAFIAACPKRCDGHVLRLSPTWFERMEFPDPRQPICELHVPLGAEALDEARRLMLEIPAAGEPVGADPLVDAESPSDAAERLIEAAMSGREIPFSSPRGLLLAGTGDVDFIEVYPAEPRRVDDVRQVPEPPARQAQRKASDEQIHEIIMDRRRKACVFSIRIATDADPTTRGRVGGLPLLPSHVDWPRAFKKPLPFLAQLPLDPLQELDSNLEPFEPGSLLTIFWGQDWWSPHPGTHGAPVFIVAGDVQERVAPDPDLILPRRSLEVVVIEEVPCWSEMQEILKMELSDPDPKRLRQFHESRWKDYPAAREATKVGGWPHWVQSPDSENPLVAQLHSEDEADLMLGDAGSLYILQRDDRSLEVLMQCY